MHCMWSIIVKKTEFQGIAFVFGNTAFRVQFLDIHRKVHLINTDYPRFVIFGRQQILDQNVPKIGLKCDGNCKNGLKCRVETTETILSHLHYILYHFLLKF